MFWIDFHHASLCHHVSLRFMVFNYYHLHILCIKTGTVYNCLIANSHEQLPHSSMAWRSPQPLALCKQEPLSCPIVHLHQQLQNASNALYRCVHALNSGGWGGGQRPPSPKHRRKFAGVDEDALFNMMRVGRGWGRRSPLIFEESRSCQ